jgi:hypothetical protein
MANWDLFFPSGTRVVALPSWKRARLYVPAHNISQRWKGSTLYPATRTVGRVYRFVLRARAATGFAAIRMVHSDNWLLGEFVRSALPSVSCAVVLAGYPGPTQKFTVQLLNERDEILGYLKYAEKDKARERLRQERQMLVSIPSRIGPKLLKYGMLSDGEALLVTAIPGNLLPSKLPPGDDIVNFLASLPTSSPLPVEDHPWVCTVCKQGRDELNWCLEVLTGRDWPVVVQHGDLAPWNLVRKPDGNLEAVDWEYGTLQGFPYLDLIYFILQTSFLVKRRTPRRAAEYAIRYLTSLPEFELTSEEARALTRLTAYGVFQRYTDEGQPPATRALGLPAPWWRTIWQE